MEDGFCLEPEDKHCHVLISFIVWQLHATYRKGMLERWSNFRALNSVWDLDFLLAFSLWASDSRSVMSNSVQFSSVTRSCPNLCDPMDWSMSGFPVHYQLPELAQTHVHQVGDAIQHPILCCPLLLLPSIFPSIRGFSNESVLRIRWLGVSALASVLPMNIQNCCPLQLTGNSLLLTCISLSALSSHNASRTGDTIML